MYNHTSLLKLMADILGYRCEYQDLLHVFDSNLYLVIDGPIIYNSLCLKGAIRLFQSLSDAEKVLYHKTYTAHKLNWRAFMRVLLVSDVESKYIWDYFDHDRFADIDLVISCGDLKSEYLSFLATMIKAPVFYVHGNHDAQYEIMPPEGCDSIEDKLVVYRGIRILGLGGSMLYGGNPSSSRPPYQYTERQMEKRIRRLVPKILLHRGFDILVTHSPAYSLRDGKDLCHTGFKSFLGLIEKYRPKYMFHGHMHMSFRQTGRILAYNGTTIIDAYNYYILDIPDKSDDLTGR